MLSRRKFNVRIEFGIVCPREQIVGKEVGINFVSRNMGRRVIPIRVKPVSLQFPNVRLFITNRLLESKESCVQTMFRSAYDLGLVGEGSLDGLIQPMTSAMCGAMWAARKVLEGFFAQHYNDCDRVNLVEKIWAALQQDIDQYKLATKLSHSRSAGVLPAATECSKMAPIVFDLMLQHLRSYH